MQCPHPRTRSRACERALTLAELTVVGVLMLVVAALLFTAITGAFRSNDRAAASLASASQVERARQMLADDIGAATAVDRVNGSTWPALALERALATGGPLEGIDASGVARTLDVRELVVAESGRVLVQTPGADQQPTCVQWSVREGSLVRDVFDWSGSGCTAAGAPRSTTTLIRPSGDGAGQVAPPFAYVVAQSTGAAQCSTAVVPAVAGAVDLARVTAVVVDLQSTSGHAKVARADGRQLRIELRSRSGAEYQRAIGCAP